MSSRVFAAAGTTTAQTSATSGAGRSTLEQIALSVLAESAAWQAVEGQHWPESDCLPWAIDPPEQTFPSARSS